MALRNIKSLLKNTGFSAASELINRAANVILFVLVSRLLGAYDAGVYTVAVSYTLIATRLTFWGLDQLLIRESAKDLQRVNKFFSNFLFLRVMLVLVTWGILSGIVSFSLPHNDVTTRTLTLLMALSILPESISNLCQAVFMAHQQMAYVTLVRTLVTVIKIVGGGVLLLLNANLITLVWIINVGNLIGMGLNLGLVIRNFVKPHFKLDLGFCVKQMRDAWPLAIGGTLYIFNERLGIIILAFFVSEAEIGIYNAAVTLISSLLLLSQAYRMAIFPMMARLYANNREAWQKLYTHSLKYMLVLALPLAIYLTVTDFSLSGILGNEFTATGAVLGIMAWTLPLLFANVPMACLLIIIDKQRVLAYSMLLQLISKVMLYFVLVPQYDVIGAASGHVVSIFLMVFINAFYISRQIQPLRIKHIGSYLLALAGMLGAVLFLRSYALWSLLFSAGIYLAILFLGNTFSGEEKTLFRNVLTDTLGHIKVYFQS